MIPDALNRAVEYLSTQRIQLPRQGTDSRHDSAAAENHIVQILQNGLSALNSPSVEEPVSIYSPNVGQRTNREWYDIKISDRYFCDIKVSALNTNDNTNAKKAIYYFLTGEEPDVPSQERIFFQKMKEKESPCENRDYFYIIVNKNNTADIFIVSLKGIAKLSPAPNNPPFQCRWNLCRENEYRTWQQAKEFLLGQWAESIKRKINALNRGMSAHYPEFF